MYNFFHKTNIASLNTVYDIYVNQLCPNYECKYLGFIFRTFSMTALMLVYSSPADWSLLSTVVLLGLAWSGLDKDFLGGGSLAVSLAGEGKGLEAAAVLWEVKQKIQVIYE